jgi:hypothetical protein
MPGPKLGGDEESKDPDQVRFHYDREERIQYLSHYTRNIGGKPKGILRGNRSLTILLVDILVIVLIYVIFSLFGGISSTIKANSGYTLGFNGFLHDDKVYLSLKVTARRNQESLDNEMIEVVFSLGRNGDELTVLEILPEEKGGSRVLRAVFDTDGGNKTALAKLRFLEKELSMKTRIRGE